MKHIIITILILILFLCIYKTITIKIEQQENFSLDELKLLDKDDILDNVSKIRKKEDIEISNVNKFIDENVLEQLFEQQEDKIEDTENLESNELIKQKNRKLKKEINRINFEQGKTLENIKNELIKIIELKEPINSIKHKYEIKDVEIMKKTIKELNKKLIYDNNLDNNLDVRINIAKLYNNISIIYNNNNNYEEALDNLEKGLKYLDIITGSKNYTNNKTDIEAIKTKALLLRNKGLLNKSKNPHEANKIFREALELYKINSDNLQDLDSKLNL